MIGGDFAFSNQLQNGQQQYGFMGSFSQDFMGRAVELFEMVDVWVE
jgi:hypothetical protein